MLCLNSLKCISNAIGLTIGKEYEILKEGTKEAKKVAEQTLYNVRNAMKINYFD